MLNPRAAVVGRSRPIRQPDAPETSSFNRHIGTYRVATPTDSALRALTVSDPSPTGVTSFISRYRLLRLDRPVLLVAVVEAVAIGGCHLRLWRDDVEHDAEDLSAHPLQCGGRLVHLVLACAAVPHREQHAVHVHGEPGGVRDGEQW